MFTQVHWHHPSLFPSRTLVHFLVGPCVAIWRVVFYWENYDWNHTSPSELFQETSCLKSDPSDQRRLLDELRLPTIPSASGAACSSLPCTSCRLLQFCPLIRFVSGVSLVAARFVCLPPAGKSFAWRFRGNNCFESYMAESCTVEKESHSGPIKRSTQEPGVFVFDAFMATLQRHSTSVWESAADIGCCGCNCCSCCGAEAVANMLLQM
jgi:hypothetical protein